MLIWPFGNPIWRFRQLSAVLKGAPAEPFFAKSKQAWDNLNLVLKNVDALLPKEDRSGFISLADLHVGAWFARVLTCVGAKQLSDVAGSFEKLLAATGLEAADVAGVRKWWESMAQRQRSVAVALACNDGLRAYDARRAVMYHMADSV